MDGQVMVLLVGEQPAPNLLPVRQYKPKGVVLLYTELSERIATNLQQVLSVRKVVRVKVPPYDVRTIRERLRRALKEYGWEGEPLTFNLTGGTKLMMLAAYSVAQETGSRCLYVVSEGGRNDFYWYGFENGVLKPIRTEAAEVTITLDEYLRVYVGGYQHDKPRDEFERAVVAALRPPASPVDEILTSVRPQATLNLEIDALVRIGNQIGLLEIKKKADKRAIDQLTTPTSREYLGTYIRRFLVSAHKVPKASQRLARAYGITVIELRSFGDQRRLDANDTTRLRGMISQRLGIAAQKG